MRRGQLHGHQQPRSPTPSMRRVQYALAGLDQGTRHCADHRDSGTTTVDGDAAWHRTSTLRRHRRPRRRESRCACRRRSRRTGIRCGPAGPSREGGTQRDGLDDATIGIPPTMLAGGSISRVLVLHRRSRSLTSTDRSRLRGASGRHAGSVRLSRSCRELSRRKAVSTSSACGLTARRLRLERRRTVVHSQDSVSQAHPVSSGRCADEAAVTSAVPR